MEWWERIVIAQAAERLSKETDRMLYGTIPTPYRRTAALLDKWVTNSPELKPRLIHSSSSSSTECPTDTSSSTKTETSLSVTPAMRKKIVFPVGASKAQFREYTGSGSLMVSVENGSNHASFIVLSRQQKEALTEYLTGGFQAPTHYSLED